MGVGVGVGEGGGGMGVVRRSMRWFSMLRMEVGVGVAVERVCRRSFCSFLVLLLLGVSFAFDIHTFAYCTIIRYVAL